MSPPYHLAVVVTQLLCAYYFGVRYPVEDRSCCLVFCQSSMYVTCDGEFTNCSVNRPLIIPEDIRKLGTAKFREKILTAIR